MHFPQILNSKQPFSKSKPPVSTQFSGTTNLTLVWRNLDKNRKNNAFTEPEDAFIQSIQKNLTPDSALYIEECTTPKNETAFLVDGEDLTRMDTLLNSAEPFKENDVSAYCHFATSIIRYLIYATTGQKQSLSEPDNSILGVKRYGPPIHFKDC